MSSPNLVLYVDDDADDRLMLEEAFAATGDHRLVTFTTAVELLAYLPTRFSDVCLVVLDINLPPQSGVELLRELKADERYRSLPVVMYTTGVNSPQAKQLRKEGVPVEEKPMTFENVQHVAGRLLAYCRHHQSKSPL